MLFVVQCTAPALPGAQLSAPNNSCTQRAAHIAGMRSALSHPPTAASTQRPCTVLSPLFFPRSTPEPVSTLKLL